MAAPSIDPEQPAFAVATSIVEAFDDAASRTATLRDEEGSSDGERTARASQTSVRVARPTVGFRSISNFRSSNNNFRASTNFRTSTNFQDSSIYRASSVFDLGRTETNTGEEGGESAPPSNQLVCYGKYGKVILWIGILLGYIVFELDHTTLYNYQNYAASQFNQISSLGALTTAGTIIIAIMKPPIAKISDAIGRVETYIIIVTFYVVSYVVCATAQSFAQYAAGYVIYAVGTTGMQILNSIIVADITSSRWRGLANSLITIPFLIIPWLSAFIVQGALDHIGWRWGIGMFAIIMPVTSLGIILPLLYFRRRGKQEARKASSVSTESGQRSEKQQPQPVSRRPTSVKAFFSAIDGGGVTLLAIGCAMFLLPMSLAGETGQGWSSPWVPAVTAGGLVVLAAFVYYETHYATNPVLPAKYFRTLSLVLACIIGLLDAFAFQITHTYMYAWVTVTHDFSARNATFLTYASGCFQVAAGLVTGWFMYRTKRYKWLLIIGVVVRLVGYGIMMKLRGSDNSIAELFVMQAIQGLGSGAVGTVVIVVAQVVVASAELGQATALILLAIFMGQAIGSSVAGAIYTNLFKPRLRHYLGSSASADLIDNVFASITSSLPASGSPTRLAINDAYSDIMRYMTIAALVASALPFLIVWFLPNLELSDKHSLSDENESKSKEKKDGTESPKEEKDIEIKAVKSNMNVRNWFGKTAAKEGGGMETVKEVPSGMTTAVPTPKASTENV